MSDMNAARKAMLRLLALFPVPAGTGRPCEVRCYLLDIDSFLESLPALEIEAAKRERAEALTRAEYDTREASLMLQLAELREEVARHAGAEATKSVCLHAQVESRIERNSHFIPQKVTFAQYLNAGWTLDALIQCGIIDGAQVANEPRPGTPAPAQWRDDLSATVAKEMELNGNAIPRNDGWGGIL